MDRGHQKWLRTVFRLRGLPNTVEFLEDVAPLLSEKLGDVPVDHIHVYSLATTLISWQDPPSKEATIMFTTPPSILEDNSCKDEWHIPLMENARARYTVPITVNKSWLTIDSCIAISGLASHPFGSWQPKGGDKTFMWIRDDLPRNLQNARAVVYGYDTKLLDSQSFQGIDDLANDLVTHLCTYGWRSPSAKPIVFLAHSLGGLVVKAALRQLATRPDEAYTRLLSTVRGAIFFGVPNLGMEQRHFQALVQNNPNEALLDDVARNSNFIRRLNEAFSTSSLSERLMCFWAYETSQSPKTVRKADNVITRQGSPEILVSRESATCRLVETNPYLTFPINATHSDMVKFDRGSRHSHIVFSMLLEILSSNRATEYGTGRNSQAVSQSNPVSGEHDGHIDPLDAALPPEPLKSNPGADSGAFLPTSSLVRAEGLPSTTLVDAEDAIHKLQLKLEQSESLMDMNRVHPFLVSMRQFGEVSEDVGVFSDAFHSMSFVWGSIKDILCVSFNLRDAFNSILDAYQDIGEELPRLKKLQPVLVSKPYLREVLIMIYKDILTFHEETIRQLRKRQWTELFTAWWRDFAPTIEQIKLKTARNKRLIENQVSIAEFEEIHNRYLISMRESNREKEVQIKDRKAMVAQWLSPFDIEAEQENYRTIRSACKDPGRWLLNDRLFKKWLSLEDCDTPLLWLNGIPGAGKTILASIVVDEILHIPDSTVAFFYYGKAILTSIQLAKKIIRTSLRSCETTYIVIDGIDECGRAARKEITSWFRTVVHEPDTAKSSIRCLFVGQDDGISVEDFRGVPEIKIKDKNRPDIEYFARVWDQMIENKFGRVIQSKNSSIQKIISARAQGMFIFADLFARYLKDQPSRAALREQLDDNNLPVTLDHVYERILHRVLESRGHHMISHIQEILGWIVCARRPLRWSEIQGAICIDLESEKLDYDREMMDSPKELFASLIMWQKGGTVDLVHGTARQFLISTDFVKPGEAHYSLAIRSLSYLSFPQSDLERTTHDIRSDLLNGGHAFYDYASTCWAMHLLDALSDVDSGDSLADLQRVLEEFIDSRRARTHKPKVLRDLKRIHKTLSPVKASKDYETIAQAVGWAKKQSSQDGQGPSPDEVLNLWQVTKEIRSVLENMPRRGDDAEKLRRFHGKNWFKCPWVNCYYYYEGFRSAAQRNRHTGKHARPFLCFVTGCPTELFGCATEDDLKKHLLKTHAIDKFDDTDNPGYPDPPKAKRSKSTKGEGKYPCPKSECRKTFTKKYSLEQHLLAHSDEKLFECQNCGERFKRKGVRDRHQNGHGDKLFICTGHLANGSIWGCQTSFKRLDKLQDHFRSKKGRKCIRPWLEEKLQAANGNDIPDGNVFEDQAGDNADVLLNAGKKLPSFQEFLQRCNLSKTTIGTSSRANPASHSQDEENTQ
ncbi:hypothetical protein FQN54_001342 [Arachnomyces sp. PD_36]|nr:hypothetical protein FQN54_001342 [Arachnomyces sp. PD_36]